MLIPTRWRNEISQELSYPIGAELLSRGLEGVPQFEELEVAFWCHQTAAEIRRATETGELVQLFEVRFTNIPPGLTGSKEGIDQGWYSETWSLFVYPVLREHKPVGRRALVERGLPAARDWLMEPRSTTWRQGHRYFEVWIRPSEQTVKCVERHGRVTDR